MKDVIAGSTQLGDNYKEANECLQERYDRPRIIHQAHIREILKDVPNLTDGNTKELCRFHDVATQDLRALRNMKQDVFDTLISVAIEIKFDKATVREWQKYTMDHKRVPSRDETAENSVPWKRKALVQKRIRL